MVLKSDIISLSNEREEMPMRGIAETNGCGYAYTNKTFSSDEVHKIVMDSIADVLESEGYNVFTINTLLDYCLEYKVLKKAGVIEIK